MSKKYFFFCRIIILSGYLLDYFGWNLLCAKPTDLDSLRQVAKVDKHLQLDILIAILVKLLCRK